MIKILILLQHEELSYEEVWVKELSQKCRRDQQGASLHQGTQIRGIIKFDPEFYEVTENSFDIDELRPELLQWECTYDVIRPHQALSYLTPLEFLERHQQSREKEAIWHLAGTNIDICQRFVHNCVC